MMKSPKLLLWILPVFVLSGCGSALRSRPQLEDSRPQLEERANSSSATAPQVALNDSYNNKSVAAPTQISLKQADQSQSIAEAMDRKIIRDAVLTLEVGAPAEVQRKIASIAETLGGFVVTSESKQRQVDDT
jgi:hypothetical protein